MHFPTRALLTAALLVGATTLAACNDENGTGTDVPDPPENPTANNTSPTVVTLTWDPVSGNPTYEIERASGAQGGSFAQIATTGATTYDDDTVDPASTYRYRIRAVRNGQAGDYTNELLVTTSTPGNVVVSADITASTTWTRDNVYTLRGFIHVTNNAVLTIEPGTRIVGDFNEVGSSLFILPGAKIMAVGEADRPIVFTSSRAPGQRQPGDWGGLILVGNARINKTGAIQVEGTGTVAGSTSGTNYRVDYGVGQNDADDSGELKYVRVEFAGYAPSNNAELNSFTFASVGSGTRLSYLQSMAGLDDSFEFFGGQADGKFLVSYESGDDHFDMSEGYQGRLQHLIALQTTVLPQRTGSGQPSGDPQGIENDGCDGTACNTGFNSTPFNVPLVANFTLVGTGDQATSGSSGGIGMLLRRGTGGYYVNGVVARWPKAGLSIRNTETFARAQSQAIPDVTQAATLLALRNILFVQVNPVFETSSSTLGAVFDAAGNALVHNTTATVQQLFAAFPQTVDDGTDATSFDWTPASGSAAATGGLSPLPGVIGTKAGTVVTGTSYVGAAPPAGDANAKWWEGWTTYSRN